MIPPTLVTISINYLLLDVRVILHSVEWCEEIVRSRTNNPNDAIESRSRRHSSFTVPSHDTLTRLEALGVRDGRSLLKWNVWSIYIPRIHCISTLVTNENFVLRIHLIRNILIYVIKFMSIDNIKQYLNLFQRYLANS